MSSRIEDLEPVTRALCEAFLARAREAGISLRVTHTLRTMDEQAKLYAQGRTLPGPIVTKAKPGRSAHNYGMAFDVCFDGRRPYPIENDPRWQRMGQLGESLVLDGNFLNWGGPNGKGDRFTFDRPHFERSDWKLQIEPTSLPDPSTPPEPASVSGPSETTSST